MAEGARLESWDHTGSVLTLLANCNRNAKRRPRPYQLYQFHPYRDYSPGGSGLRICQANKDLLRRVIQSRMRRQSEQQRKGGSMSAPDD